MIYVEIALLTVTRVDRMIPTYIPTLCFGAPFGVSFTKHMSLRECTVLVFTFDNRCPTCEGLRYSVDLGFTIWSLLRIQM